ncbi:hypothetical protein HBH92_185090 [Parastagonospora nodorum]|nr:hypothetical protein HBI10_076980 [Parastagonospora nodorum]KAH4026016.1 hypothetical protein HBI13_072800 [Parastagonospora nodorum]KAH4050142.1 hypothetical protein HBH49_128680 [Parastagonospora nodorum]KAH4158584.1 hypothetical protein HBH43_191440 [Parastagonospora nodorum]KAH4405054.1 hypothetical protein HBH92_185090 [Parastagonospora nodorum]
MFYLTNPRLCNKIIGFNLKRQVSGDVTGKSSVRDVTFKRNVLASVMPSIIASKPQVAFSKRLTDPSLYRLTIVQLRRKAHERQLDVSHWAHKWKFVHALLALVQQHAEDIPKVDRRTIFDVPGEIRNQIYGYLLIGDVPVVAQYGKLAMSHTDQLLQREYPTDMDFWASAYTDLPSLSALYSQPEAASELLALSRTSRELRKEVRAFFFAFNHFRVLSSKSTGYQQFFEHIGANGRMNIQKLTLSGTEFFHHNAAFETLFGSCVNLRELEIRLHIGNIVNREMYEVLSDFDFPDDQDYFEMGDPDSVFSPLLSIFNLLPALQKLLVVIALPDWSVPYPWGLPRRLGLGVVRGRRDGLLREDILFSIIKQAVEERLVQVLKGKNVQANVDVKMGAPPELPWDKEGDGKQGIERTHLGGRVYLK